MTATPAPADVTLKAAKDKGPESLDPFAPAVDELADMQTLADYLGVKYPTLRQVRDRSRSLVTSPPWPEPVSTFGGSPVWTYRSVIVFWANRPGPGNKINHPRGDPQ